MFSESIVESIDLTIAGIPHTMGQYGYFHPIRIMDKAISIEYHQSR